MKKLFALSALLLMLLSFTACLTHDRDDNPRPKDKKQSAQYNNITGHGHDGKSGGGCNGGNHGANSGGSGSNTAGG